MDLQDPKSASVSAQTECDYIRELAEGELASCPRGFPPASVRARAKQDSLFKGFILLNSLFSLAFPGGL